MVASPGVKGDDGLASADDGGGGGGGGSSKGQDLVLKVLGAVGTGIGILGFVTFFGGAILWLRAKAAGLPANEAVAVIPKAVLVTTGASFLVPAVLLALLAVLVIAGVHVGFSLRARLVERESARRARELRSAAGAAIRDAEQQEHLAASARALATKQAGLLEDARRKDAPGAHLRELQDQAEAQAGEAQAAEMAARQARSAAERRMTQADNAQATLEMALRRARGSDIVQRGFECGAAVIVLAVLPLALDGHLGHFGRALVLITVAAVAVVVSVATYLATEKFLWFGVVAFIAVGFYTGATTYFRTVDSPKVEPVAALRGTRPPLTGVFIADTPDNLYVGTFRRGDQQPVLLVIPRSQITDLAVGPLLPPPAARGRAVVLARAECHQRIQQANRGKAVAAAFSCTNDQEATLSTSQ
jgi:hypothetical protein